MKTSPYECLYAGIQSYYVAAFILMVGINLRCSFGSRKHKLFRKEGLPDKNPSSSSGHFVGKERGRV